MGFEGELSEVAKLCFAAAHDVDPDNFSFSLPSPEKVVDCDSFTKQPQAELSPAWKRRSGTVASQEDAWTSSLQRGSLGVEVDVLHTNLCIDAAREFQRAALFNVFLGWCRVSWRCDKVKSSTRRRDIAWQAYCLEAWQEHLRFQQHERGLARKVKERLCDLRKAAIMKMWLWVAMIPSMLIERDRRFMSRALRVWHDFASRRQRVKSRGKRVALRLAVRSLRSLKILRDACRAGREAVLRQTAALLAQVMLVWRARAAQLVRARMMAKDRGWVHFSPLLSATLDEWRLQNRVHKRSRTDHFECLGTTWRGWRRHVQLKRRLKVLAQEEARRRPTCARMLALEHWHCFSASRARCRLVAKMPLQAMVSKRGCLRRLEQHVFLRRRRTELRRHAATAVESYARSVQGIALSWWVAALQLVAAQANNVAHLHWSAGLQLNALEGWRSAIHKRQLFLSLSSRSRTRSQRGLARHCLDAWLWCRSLTVLGATIARRASHRLLLDSLYIWRMDIILRRQASAHRKRHLGNVYLTLWYAVTAAVKSRRTIATNFQIRRKQASQVLAMRHLHNCATQLRTARHFFRRCSITREIRLAACALIGWANAVHRAKRKKETKLISQRLWATTKLEWTHRAWLAYHMHWKWCSQVVAGVLHDWDISMMHKHLQAWVMLVGRRRREVNGTSGVRDFRKKRVMRSWAAMLSRKYGVASLLYRRDVNIVVQCLRTWKDLAASTRKQRHDALEHWRCWTICRRMSVEAMHELAECSKRRDLRRGFGSLVRHTCQRHEARRDQLSAKLWALRSRSKSVQWWHRVTMESRLMHAVAAEAGSAWQQRLSRSCIEHWRLRARLGRGWKVVLHCLGLCELQHACFTVWHDHAASRSRHMNAVTHAIAIKHLRLLMMAAWGCFRGYTQARRACATLIQLARKRLTSRHWHRGLSALARNIRHARFQHAASYTWERTRLRKERWALATWRQFLFAKAVDHECAEVRFERQAVSCCEAAFALWRSAVLFAQRARKVSDQTVYQLVAATFRAWKQQCTARRIIAAEVEVRMQKHAAMSQRQALRQWSALLLFVKMAHQLCDAAALRQAAACFYAWAFRSRAIRRYTASEGVHPDTALEELESSIQRNNTEHDAQDTLEEGLRAAFLAWVTHMKWRRSKRLATDLAIVRVRQRRIASARASVQHWHKHASHKRCNRSSEQSSLSPENPGLAQASDAIFTPPTAAASQADFGDPVTSRQYSELRCEVDLDENPEYDPAPTFGQQRQLPAIMEGSQSASGGEETEQKAIPHSESASPQALRNLLLSAAVYAAQVPEVAAAVERSSSPVAQATMDDDEEDMAVPDECSFHQLPSHEPVVHVVAVQRLGGSNAGVQGRQSASRTVTSDETIDLEDDIADEGPGQIRVPVVCSPRIATSRRKSSPRTSSESPPSGGNSAFPEQHQSPP